jgi:hypothetical protein
MSETGNTPSEVSRLVLKAVKSLPEEEQQAVFAYFLERGLSGAPGPSFAPPMPEGGSLQAALRAVGALTAGGKRTAPGPAGKSTGGPHQTIPVRLPETQHRRLKEWCAEHNFPMAAVIRGLIDRFLDSWEQRAA